VIIDGVDVTNLPVYKRDCGQVFQSFSLFPHMTVFNNVAFPLMIRKIPHKDIRRRVMEVLELVDLQNHVDKYPNQLSGGQQQRVGLCRALVYRPKVLLFDEPLSNLDAKLREAMRFEIREIQLNYKITSVFVTHDQQEALAISDRIAIMENGRIIQNDIPDEIYKKPQTEFVANFIGLANLLPARVVSSTMESCLVNVGNLQLKIKTTRKIEEGKNVICSIRPKDIQFLSSADNQEKKEYNIFQANVERKTFLGDHIDYNVSIADNITLRMKSDIYKTYEKGSKTTIYIPEEYCWLIVQ
jgi:ABC-type Fe3+/spermidine/putrescine transport system ATPase subunit